MGEPDASAAVDSWPRPRLVVSACLELEPCRYNGQSIRARFLHRLMPFVELVPVCPEVEIGLGVPRPAIRMVRVDDEDRLVQPATGRDVSEDMRTFAADFLDPLEAVDGFLLKSRSPSCGPAGVKLYAESGTPRGDRRPGFFAAEVQSRFPHTAIEDEGRLTNARLRNHFLARLFQNARLRLLPPEMRELVSFHADNKLLLLAHSETGMRQLGRTVANAAKLPAVEVKRMYREQFAVALSQPPRRLVMINVLMHAMGHFSEDLLGPEKALFLRLLDDYRERRGGVEAPMALLRGWIARHGSDWLESQTLFEPFPLPLLDLEDSAK